MGHEIEKIATERGHTIVAIFDNDNDWQNKSVPPCDIVIDFSTPDSAYNVVNRCFDENIPVLSGTTGWSHSIQILAQRAVNEEKAFFYASNYSLGVNIFSLLNKRLASLLCNFKEYTVKMQETHHVHKKDAPSGTAILLAQGIIENCSRYNSWTLSEGQNESSLPIESKRIGEVPGTHSILWSSANDCIEITHTAHNRKGFALGAVIAAEWMQGRKGYYSMSDLMNDLGV